MNMLLKSMTLCFITLLVTGCFPGNRAFVVQDCGGPGSILCGEMPNGSEFTFVKQPNGSNYKIWVNQKPDITGGPMLVLKNCEAPVENNKFECAHCGGPKSFMIKKIGGSKCDYSRCVKIVATSDDPTKCPTGGEGKGGSN